MLDTRFLASLIAVIDCGSIAGAARLQNLSAAAVSQRIRVLEQEIGCELLIRTAHAASPTADCLQLLPAAKELVQSAERLLSAVDPNGLSGRFRLGAISTALFDYIPAIIKTLERDAPKAELVVRPGSSSDLYNLLEGGEIDAALLVSPSFETSKRYIKRSIAKQSFAQILPPDLKPESSEQKKLPWIVYDRSSWGGRIAANEIDQAMGEGRVLCELDSPETIALMVEQGIGQSILPVWPALQRHHPRLSVWPIRPERPLFRDLILLENLSGPSPAIASLVCAAASAVSEGV